MVRSFLISLIFLTGLQGCINIEDPENIPHIEYKEHDASFCEDQLGNLNKCITLTFNLKDGDGNMGLLDSDTAPPFTGIYRHNFYFELFVLDNGTFAPWEGLAINYFDIPYLVPQGQNKILIADVDIDLSFPVNSLTYDTLKIEFFVFDRALNQSNVASTDTIFFQQNPI